jgi:alpha,alpha-trehalose phosphorylase
MAAEVGHLDLALDYLGEAALMDLRDLERNTRDGLHMASLAGAWTALVGGLGGFRAGHGAVCFAPRLPSGISRLRFRLRYRARGIAVSVTAAEATYELLAGEPIELSHHGGLFTLGATAVTHAIPHLEPSPRPAQPAGRAPVRRLQARAAPPRG